jgi:branched-chain amino acid transport system substrate-binding protein
LNNVILLATTDTPGGLSEADFDDNVFLLALSQAQHAYATCGYFVAALGAQTFVQIAPDYPAGRRAAAAYRAACVSAGGEFVAADQLLPTATIDFDETVAELANENPDAVLLTWPIGGTGSLLESVSTGFPTGTAFGVSFAPDAVIPLFFDSAVGWTSPTTYSFVAPNNPENDYLIEQAEMAGSTPDRYDALGMNAALLAVAALRESAGGADPDALKAALEAVEVSGPKGRLTVRASDHLVIQDTYIVTLVNTDDPGHQYYEMVATVRPEPPCLLEGEEAARSR